MNTSVKAVIKINLTMVSSGSWGDDCQVSQIKKQGLENILQKLSKALGKSQYGIECISDPEVLKIIIEEPYSTKLPEVEKITTKIIRILKINELIKSFKIKLNW